MQDSRKIQAIALRQQGRSISEIASLLGAAKSSVSIWTKDIRLTTEQTAVLKAAPQDRKSVV